MASKETTSECEWKAMENELKEAACNGDVKFLRQAIQSHRSDTDYWLSQFEGEEREPYTGGNILHLAAWHNQENFFQKAIKRLPIPREKRLMLLCQQHHSGELLSWNPFHVAAYKGHTAIVVVIKQFLEEQATMSLLEERKQPWPSRAQDLNGRTPFHLALMQAHKECAFEVYLVDTSVDRIDDDEGNSALFLAVQNRLVVVAEFITHWSNKTYSVNAPNGSSPLHLVPRASGDVCQSLLRDHPKLIKQIDKDGNTVLHKWVEAGKKWPFNYVYYRLRKFVKIMFSTEFNYGNNPLHTLSTSSNDEISASIAEKLLDAYQLEIEQQRLMANSDVTCGGASIFPDDQRPWLMKNKNGDIPFLLALRNGLDKLAMQLLSVDDVVESINSCQENPLILAIDKGCDNVVENILKIIADNDRLSTLLHFNDGENFLHIASKYPENFAKLVITKFPPLINERNKDGKTPLDSASEAGADWLIQLMLTEDPSSLKKAPSSWITACENGHLDAVIAFIDHCPYFREFCLGCRDTPLHYIQKVQSYAKYKEFLEDNMMQEFKNTKDIDGATPLHKAIERRDIDLTEALLTMDGIDCTSRDNTGRSPMDLLAEVCVNDQKWDDMCKRVGIDPRLKTTYVQRETNLLEMRGTLLVVAALLATITFTAGFTLPGGFNSDNGRAILGKQATFMIFLLTDTYAMCCSMLVFFCLIWSMTCDRNKSLLLIDRSMVFLVQSLYGTLVAFMTGVFAVIFHKSLWAGILIFVMCSFIAISASMRTILFKLLEWIPAAGTEEGCLRHARRCWRHTDAQNSTEPDTLV